MIQTTVTQIGQWTKPLWIAQAPVTQAQANPELQTPEAASVLFSGPQFFIALVSGILLAFAIQLVLTNLSVAAGISYLGRSSDSDHHSSSHHSDEPSGVGTTIRKISTGVGIWTLISASIALFIACYLAVQLSLVTSSLLGAIVGLVIWAAYFSIMVWVGSSTVGSLIGSVVNAATSGFQTILGTATAALGAGTARRQVVSTAEAAAAAVRNELGSMIDPTSIRNSVEDYIRRLPLPGFDMTRIRSDFESLLRDPEIQSLADSGQLRNIDRQTFVDLVSRRTDFTPQEVNRIADLLENVWRQTLGRRSSRRDSLAELTDYLQSTQPGQVELRELNAKIDRLIAERQQSQPSADPQKQQNQGMLQQGLALGMNSLIGMVMGRADLSDMDVETILNKLKGAPAKLSEQASSLSQTVRGGSSSSDSFASSPIRIDVENYLLNSPSWQMSTAAVDRDFREVIYDAAADPYAIRDQLGLLNRQYFVELLTSRGVFTQDRIQQVADQLERIRQSVLQEAQSNINREIAEDLRRRIELYIVSTPKPQLFSNETLPEFKSVLEDSEADYETMSVRLAPYDRAHLYQLLSQRQDVAPEEVDSILNGLERTRDQVLSESRSLNEQAKERLATAQQRLEEYLRSTGKEELNPEGIKRDLNLLFNDPQLGLSALRSRASRVDRETLVQLMSQRQDMTPEESQRVIDQVESNWNGFTHAPQNAAGAVKDQYDQTLNSVADYLRRTNREELNPEGIKRDLNLLLNDPKQGGLALRRRLSQVDRETLVQLLSQRQDMSEEQVNRTIDQVQDAIRQVTRAPRRLALRTQQRVMDFESTIEEYLRNTNKEELSPEGIKRDLNLLVHSPRAGVQNFADRLSRVDRSTLIALLSQRQDMTEEEADRVVSQIESTRDQIVDQVKQVQYRIQEVIDRLFNTIRDYLNGLDRPELNYEGITQDVRTLFDDPKAGFEALRDRLSQFDRGTLVAIMSSRRDISEDDANRVIDQIEGARTSVLQRAERIQMEAQRRVELVKRQAQEQMEETRKAAASAAWWLFITAVVSASVAAIAGALAAA